MLARQIIFSLLLLFVSTFLLAAESAVEAEKYCEWTQVNLSIDKALCGLKGNAERGREVVIDKHKGNCLACHMMPISEAPLHGTIGPPLYAIGSRLTEGQIRLRVVDELQINPDTVMPGFYRDPSLANRVADEYWGKTFLTAQQVEDVVAYLVTLK